jgi:V8-like Glu-specific endopeptidase
VQIDALRAITAAHCLYNKEGGGVVNLEEIRVVKDADPSHVSVRVSSAEMFPGFAITSRAVDNFNYDVAVLTFSDVMPGSFRNPNTFNIPLRLGDELSTAYYKNIKRRLQLVETPCNLLNRKKSLLVLDCPVDFGASGAPVYRLGQNGSSDLVAIIVAKAMWGNKRVALAVKVGSV